LYVGKQSTAKHAKPRFYWVGLPTPAATESQIPQQSLSHTIQCQARHV
jgi:hypothetical protein